MKRINQILTAAMLVSTVSCIENDLSFPDVNVEIAEISIEGAKETKVDYESFAIEIVLEETANLSAVKVSNLKLAEGASVVGQLPEVLDLRQPYKFKMKVYEEEEWTISAVQPISRYIKCQNQVGDASIDAEKKFAIVYVVDSQPLDKVVITDIKLEPEGSEVVSTSGYAYENGQSYLKVEECVFPIELDCTLTRHFNVVYKSKEIDWEVLFLTKPAEIGITSINAWTYCVEIEGNTSGSGTPVIEYRKEGDENWTPAENIEIDGTRVKTVIYDLTEDTAFSTRLVCGDKVSSEENFRTGRPEQLENMDFETWHQADPHDCWYPFTQGQESGVWGTANPGTNFLNPMNPTRPEYEHVAVPGGTAVRLESMTPFGVFAAGNIFSGRFNKFSFSDMTAYLEWGTPFKGRPYSLKGYLDYAPVQIDKTQDKVSGKPNPHKDKLGLMDHLQILAVLVDEAENEADKGPFPVVSTKPGVPDLKNDPRVIAFGTIESSENTEGKYKEFECVLEYKDNREPDYVIVVACSSLWGNYFTGGVGSVLYVDDFQFVYR